MEGEEDLKRKKKEAIQALIMAEVMTGGTFMESLFPVPKPRPKSICPMCRNDCPESAYICRNGTKTLFPGTEILIKSCTNFEPKQ